MFSTSPWRVETAISGKLTRVHVVSKTGKVIAEIHRPNRNGYGNARLMSVAREMMEEAHRLAVKYGDDDEKERVMRLISFARGQTTSEKENPDNVWKKD